MEATLPLLVPRESPSDVETLDQLRELLLSEDEVKLVVLECFHGGQNAASSLSPIKPVPFTQRAELARAYPSLSIHHVALTGAEGKSIEHALRFHVAPRCIVCAGGPQPRALVRRQVSNQEKLPAFLDQLVHDPPSPTAGDQIEFRRASWLRSPAAASDCIVFDRWSCYSAQTHLVFALFLSVTCAATFFVCLQTQQHS